MNPEQSNPIVDAAFKAIAYTENGGKPGEPKEGKTGEMKSIFQYTHPTWLNYSKEVTGQSIPISPEAEAYVTHKKLEGWINKDIQAGYSPQDAAKRAASRWNAGEGEPDAYTGKFSSGSPSVGINKKYGVKYSVPDYVKTFDRHFNEFSNPSDKLSEGNKIADAQIQNTELMDRGDTVLNQEQQMDWHQKNNPKKSLLSAVKQKKGKKEGLFKPSSLSV